MSSAENIYAKMHRTKNGYGYRDFETLYLGYGFRKKEGGDHTLYFHELLRRPMSVPRHNELPIGYVRAAVKAIDDILRGNEAIRED